MQHVLIHEFLFSFFHRYVLSMMGQSYTCIINFLLLWVRQGPKINKPLQSLHPNLKLPLFPIITKNGVRKPIPIGIMLSTAIQQQCAIPPVKAPLENLPNLGLPFPSTKCDLSNTLVSSNWIM